MVEHRSEVHVWCGQSDGSGICTLTPSHSGEHRFLDLPKAEQVEIQRIIAPIHPVARNSFGVPLDPEIAREEWEAMGKPVAAPEQQEGESGS